MTDSMNHTHLDDLGAPDRVKERRKRRRDKRNFWIVRVIVWTIILIAGYCIGANEAHKRDAEAPATSQTPLQGFGDVDKSMEYKPERKFGKFRVLKWRT